MSAQAVVAARVLRPDGGQGEPRFGWVPGRADRRYPPKEGRLAGGTAGDRRVESDDAELTATPYTSVLAGIAIEDARVAAERDFGISLRWIFDIPGEFGLPAAEATVGYAVDHGPSSLIGFGLGGPEVGVGRAQFKPFFDRARAAGLHSVPHAGETTGPQTIWEALTLLGAERIGHGTSATEDDVLVSHVVDNRIPLEVCPTSNIATRAVDVLENHPIRAMYEAGVLVTVNSDDPPMFGTTLNREYEIAARLLDLDETEIAQIAKNAVAASFLPETEKAALTGVIDGYLAQHTAE